ncbi:flagellar hook-associated protein 2 [Paenibacillus sp. J31TS4]|uniref:flagellar hook-associated protein 2 n=1 Tax=Paenibacillus sp. J31TS4 TaxID=2807195 RepID=UPI001B092DCD|nr:flagellar hook-associated protein 2 [Paenibacillus sp. J31TS4]GIP40990.1 flagellar hook-associated protein 2 [Paenibacillus sp. J31TS4]
MVMRIGGLVSGMDTDTIVRDLMKARRLPLDKLKQNKQLLEWKRTDYRDMNSKLTSFRDLVFNMKLQGTFMAKKAESSDDKILTVGSSTSANAGTYTIRIDELAEAASLTSGALEKKDSTTTMASLGLLTDTKLTITGEKGTETIDVATTDSISGLINAINAKSTTTGVKASYDENLGRLFFTSTTTGEKAKVELTSDDKTFLSGKLKLAQTTAEGKNAKVTYNGDIPAEFASNTFTINGISFTAKQAQMEGAPPIRVTVNQDVDSAFNTIKSFVEKYNELISTINTKVTETRYRNFAPLSDEQKEAMKDKEVDLWEDKAKSGLLKGDSTLSSILNSMRVALSTPVTGLPDKQINQLSQIGIKTGAYQDKGKLYLDEAKLKQAISENPDQVMALFTASDGKDTSSSADGLAFRLYDEVNGAVKALTEKAGTAAYLTDNSLISKDLRDIDDRITALTNRLTDIESRYYRQFSAMEAAMNKANAQSSSLAQYFSTGR